MSNDPWAVLGVPPTASDQEIHAAYRRLAARHHPDRPGGDAARMAAINEAYAAIRSPLPARAATATTAAATSATARSTQAPTTAVLGAGTSRPLGCAMVVAIGALVVAVTIAVVVAVASRSDDGATAARRSTPSTTIAPRPGVVEPAPWLEARLPRSASPLAVSQWQLSDAAATCPLLVPAGADAGGTTRALQVDGGWGVSWGRPNEPELFGVTARPPSGRRGRPQAEAELTWSDGSTATLYRDDDRLVADLTIEGIDCRYGVFSTLGFGHLSEVLGALRFVAT